MKINKPFLEYAILAVVIAGAIFIYLQIVNRDVNLCRYVFNSLLTSKPAAEKYIDWEHLQAVGADIGATYRALPNDQEKTNYRMVFFRTFPKGFEKFHGQPKAFRNWRNLGVKDGKTIVAVDYLAYNKTLLFFLSKLHGTKIVSIQWE